MKKTLKIMSVIIDVLAVIFNLLLAGLYVYALTRGYTFKELDMGWEEVLLMLSINGTWSLKYVIIKIANFTKWLKSRKK